MEPAAQFSKVVDPKQSLLDSHGSRACWCSMTPAFLLLLLLCGFIGRCRGTARGLLRQGSAAVTMLYTSQFMHALSSAPLLLHARTLVGRPPHSGRPRLLRAAVGRLRAVARLAGGCAVGVAAAALLQGLQKLPGFVRGQEAPARAPDAARGVVVPRLVQVRLHAK